MSRAPNDPILDLSPQIAGDLARMRRALEEAALAPAKVATSAAPASMETAVHAARRCIKMLRATVRLLGKPKDDPLRKACDDALRTMAGTLSHTRDLHVAAATVGTLRKGLDGRKRKDGKALRTGLDRLAREWSNRADAIERNRRVKGDAPALEALEAMAQQLQTAIAVSALTGNAAQTYRKARRLLRASLKGGDAEALHAARGLVVRHQLQSKALRAITGKGKGRLKRLDALRDAMGEHHDLAVMEMLAGETPHAAELSEGLAALVRKRQEALEDLCRPLANELFAASPVAYRQKLETRLTRAMSERAARRDHKTADNKGSRRTSPAAGPAGGDG